MQKLSQTEELARELASHARRHTVTPEQISRAMDEKDYDVAQLDELYAALETRGVHLAEEETGHKMVDEIGGATPVAAVQWVSLLVELGQGGFNESGGGTNQRSDPHPEHGTRAAGRNSRHHAHQVSHADPCGGGHDQRLEAGNAFLFGTGLLFQRDMNHLGEEPHRQEPGAERKKDARRHQDQNQQRQSHTPASGKGNGNKIAPHKIVNGIQQLHFNSPKLFFSL